MANQYAYLQECGTLNRVFAAFFMNECSIKDGDVAKYFSNAVKAHQYCDFVFSSLPDGNPFIYDCIVDPDTNFRCRLIIGRDLANDEYSAIWEFYCLLVSKYREGEPHPIYGKTYKDADQMTDKERAKWI